MVLCTAGLARSQTPLSAEHAAVLAAIRAYALDYTQHLPDYTCFQVTKRRTVPVRASFGPARPDIIEEQLTFSNRKETYQVLSFNGIKVTNVEHFEVTGVILGGEFGRLLFTIFDPQSGTDFRFDGMSKRHGEKVVAFAYQVPQARGFHLNHRASGRALDSAIQGLVYADSETGKVLEITMKCVGLPADFGMKDVRLVLEYRPVAIADQEYLLPFHSEMHMRDERVSVTSQIDYTRYRKFVSDSKLTFEGDDGPKQ